MFHWMSVNLFDCLNTILVLGLNQQSLFFDDVSIEIGLFGYQFCKTAGILLLGSLHIPTTSFFYVNIYVLLYHN